jgi:ferric-dicitrate binding protein FerR (iron transport regulator)
VAAGQCRRRGADGAAAPHALLLARSDLRSSDAPRVVQLDDGSTAVLDAGTALAIEFDGQQRHLRLLRGQAWFRWRTSSPFQVEAAGGVVRDIGTAFSVSMLDTTVTTQVSEGVVDVRRAMAACSACMPDRHARSVTGAGCSRCSWKIRRAWRRGGVARW